MNVNTTLESNSSTAKPVNGEEPTLGDVRKVKIKQPPKRKGSSQSRRKVQYVSRHFRESDQEKRDKIKVASSEVPLFGENAYDKAIGGVEVETDIAELTAISPAGHSSRQPRIYYGINVDELSSDSELTDVPDDIGPDPFGHDTTNFNTTIPTTVIKVKKVKKTHFPTKSPYFPLTLTQGYTNKQRQNFVSTLPFPSLSDQTFGLMQERLAHQPFKLLIATIFLNKTPGARAMPIFYELMKEYPSPEALADAEVSDVTAIIHQLGFQNQRARKCVAMAKEWVRNPPVRGRRYRKLNYPEKGDGRNIGVEEVVPDEDDMEDDIDDPSEVQTDHPKVRKIAWEISHLPGLGPYSHDSWRMFCRDELRGLATDWLGSDAQNHGRTPIFEPEWKRVLPQDKELRAYLTWMWLKEGWVWNKETGARTKASKELMKIAQGGGVVIEEADKEVLAIQGVDSQGIRVDKAIGKVDKTAGDFLPSTNEKLLSV